MIAPLRIILTDDDPDDQLFFQAALTATNIACELVIADDADKLMDSLDHHNTPDLIFMDINMPRKDGLECLTEIRENKRFLEVPVIMLSTSMQKRFIKIAYELGANKYLVKPYEIEKLTTMLYETLSVDWRKIPRLTIENFARL
jgi:CheY-like chemotaxis protein